MAESILKEYHCVRPIIKYPGSKWRLAGWIVTGWGKLQMSAKCECGGARMETLWLNYEPEGQQITLM